MSGARSATSEPEHEPQAGPDVGSAARGEQQADDLSILLRQVDDQAPARQAKRRKWAIKAEHAPNRTAHFGTVQNCPRQESEQHGQSAFTLPIVSVATYGEDGHRKRSVAREMDNGNPGKDECGFRLDHDESPAESCTAASTTSDVNSLDGAESIASRLSQIVDEQEFLMNHALAGVSSGISTAPNPTAGINKATPMNLSVASRESGEEKCSLASKKSAGELMGATRNDGGGDRIAPSNSLEDPATMAKRLRDRTKSFASQAHGGELSGIRKLAERRNESSGSIYLGGQVQFHPERGDLRSLKQALSNNSCDRQNSSDRASSGELMLNIRRSAWKLDEFEQAFKPPEADFVSAADSAAASGGDPDSGGDSPDRRTPFERQTVSTSSTKNFLIRASRKFTMNWQRPSSNSETTPAQLAPKSSVACLLQNNSKRRFSHSDTTNSWQHQQQVQLQNQIQQANSHASKNLLSVNAGPKKSELEYRRSSGISMVSFASSVDSSQTTGRPFGRLGSLLSGSQRHRHRHPRDSNKDDPGCQCTMTGLAQYVPVLDWLPAYKWRQDFLADLTAGLAVAVLNISTSLSAAVVAETELGVAFRSSIFNTFVYAVLCSSRHSSFGSWSIMSQMLLDSVRRALGDELILSRIHLGPQASWNAEEYEMWHMNIIIMYTFLIGLVQLLAGILNLGNILASFIPEALCSSMIAATAFTMAVGQLANMCGTSNKVLWAIEKNTTELAWADLKQPVSITDLFSGLFRWIQQIALLLKHYEQINLVACIISTVTVILLFINQSWLQEKLRVWFKKDNLFIPFEMILLIMWICFAYALELRDKYHVATCGPIFIEFNMPNVPNLRLVRELWLDSLATALISYTMVFIMAKTYSNKFNYEINGNQELIACGAGNLIGGLFDALPATASFSRTAGQVEAGGRTQMASLVNCVTLVVLAQYLGHHVSHLPVCVMSATLFFGFVRMMTRTREALVYWRLCKVDFVIWFFTFCAIITFDLVNGFVYGFIFSLLTMLYRAQSRRCYMLGSIGSSDVYVPLPKYPLAHELDGIKIFQFCGPIHYVCADLFERLLRQKTRVNVKELLKEIEQEKQQQQRTANSSQPEAAKIEDGAIKIVAKEAAAATSKPSAFNPRDMSLPTHIILDFSMISNLDTAGIRIIKKIILDYQRVNITIMLASLASHVAQSVKSDPSLWEEYKDRFYLTLADAVHHALRDNNRPLGMTGGKLG